MAAISQKTYDHITNQEWKGQRVRTLIDISNGYCTVPAGTVLTITRKFNGFTLEVDPCKTCNVRIRFTRVQPYKLEVVL